MASEQVVPGKFRGSHNAFTSACYRGKTYLAYTAEDSVVILTQQFATQQVLSLAAGEKASALAWNESTGTLAVAIGTTAVLFTCDISHGKLQWSRGGTVNADEEVQCLCWSEARNELLLCGKSIALWFIPFSMLMPSSTLVRKEVRVGKERENPVLKWKTQCVSPISFCTFSPDGKFFATAGANDRYPKMWRQVFSGKPKKRVDKEREEGEQQERYGDDDKEEGMGEEAIRRRAPAGYDIDEEEERDYVLGFRFQYLAHPRAVTMLQWRTGRKLADQNMLLTNSRDHISRVWLECESDNFTTCAVINGAEGHIHSWLTYHQFVRVPDPRLTENELSLLKWNDEERNHQGEEFEEAMEKRERERLESFSSSSSSTVEDSDWIISVKDNHLIDFWRVTGLLNSATRSFRNIVLSNEAANLRFRPELTEWLKTKVSRAHRFFKPTFILTMCKELSGASTNCPRKVSFYLMNEDNDLCAWQLQITETTEHRSSESECVHINGHRGKITSLRAHPTRPLVSTLSLEEDGELLLWESSSPILVEREPLTRALNCLHKAQVHAWLPDRSVLVVAMKKSLLFYSFPSLSFGEEPVLMKSFPTALADGRKLRIDSMEIMADEEHYHVIAHAHNGRRLCVWRVAQDISSRAATFESTFTTRFPESSAVTSMALVSPFSSIAERNDIAVEGGQQTVPQPYQLVTGSNDGLLKFWRLHSPDPACEKEVWKEVHCILAHTATIRAVQCLGSSTVLSVGPAGREDSKTRGFVVGPRKEAVLDIRTWEWGMNPPTLALGQSLAVPFFKKEEAATVGLFLTAKRLSCGGHVLALSVAETLCVFAQVRTEDMGVFVRPWKMVHTRTLPSACSGLAWNFQGVLFAAQSRQLHVISPWSDLVPRADRASTEHSLQHACTLAACPPPYHPKSLMQHLMAGHFDRVGRILHHMYRSVVKEEDAPAPPPLSLSVLLASEEDAYARSASGSVPMTSLGDSSKEGSLFSSRSTSATIFDSEEASQEGEPAPTASEEDLQWNTITDEQASELAEVMSSTSLPGMSSAAQMRLLAIITSYTKVAKLQTGMDEAGLRFLVAEKLHALDCKGKSTVQKPLPSQAFSWAIHSEAQDALVTTCLPPGTLWARAQQLSVGFWLTNPVILRRVVEDIGKAQFSVNRKPEEAAVFYMALGKKGALIALYRAAQNMKVANFLLNDFNQERWKTAAMKNAFKLLGQQDFAYACAFFLLAGDLRSAVNVCVKHMRDFNLPLVFCRLLEGDNGPHLFSLLEDTILPQAESTGDVWLASTALWLQKKYFEALHALIPHVEDFRVEPDELKCMTEKKAPSSVFSGVSSVNTIAQKKREKEMLTFHPAVVHFYRYLCKKPFISRRPSPADELVLLRQALFHYLKAGCPILAIEELLELQKLEENAGEDTASAARQDGSMGMGLLASFMAPPPAAAVEQVTSSNGGQGAKREDIAIAELAKRDHAEQAVFDLLSRGLASSDAAVMNVQEELSFLEDRGVPFNRDRLLERLATHCLAQNLLHKYFVVLYECDADAAMVLLERSAATLATLGDQLRLLQRVTRPQARGFVSKARQLYSCMRFLLNKGVSVNTAIVEKLMFSAMLTLCMGAWVLRHYEALETLLTGTELVFPFPKPVEKAMSELESRALVLDNEKTALTEVQLDADLGQTVAGKEAERYLLRLLRLLTIRRYLEIAQERPGLLVPGVEAFYKTLYHQLKRTPFFTSTHVQDCNLEEAYFASGTRQVLNDLLQRSHFTAEQVSLINALIKICGKPVMVGLDLATKVTEERAARGKESMNMSFCRTCTAYRDQREVLLSFCIHPIDPGHIVVGTAKGIKAIEVPNVLKTKKKDKEVLVKSHEEAVASPLLKQRATMLRGNLGQVEKKSSLSSFFGGSTSSPSKPRQLPTRSSVTGVTSLEAHPSKPFYISGSTNGSVYLWLFHHNDAIAEVREANSTKVGRIRFNSAGSKFAVPDLSGHVSLWRFTDQDILRKPYLSLYAHSKRTYDVAFCNAGSLFATAGLSKSGKNLSLWDALMPPSKARVHSFACHEDGGAVSVLYSARHQVLITGGKKGVIAIFDVRQRSYLSGDTAAHAGPVHSLSLDAKEGTLVSGGGDAVVKVWAMPMLVQTQQWQGVHQKQGFRAEMLMSPSASGSKGVTQVQFSDASSKLYSCGADGILAQRTILH